MGLKKITTVIITCLLLNTPGFPASSSLPRIDNPLPAAKSSVFQLVALMRLPFAVTANMFSEDLPPVPGYWHAPSGHTQQDGAGRQDSGKEDRDQKCFLSSQGKDAGFDLKTGTYGDPLIGAARFLPRGTGAVPLPLVFLWLGFKYIFLLTCLLALLKSTLPWEIRYLSV